MLSLYFSDVCMMEVVIQSSLPHVPGELVIPTSSDETLSSLIQTFCNSHGIARQNYHQLRTVAQQPLESHKRLDYYDIHNGDILILGLKRKSVL